jgi:hypothetical protein
MRSPTVVKLDKRTVRMVRTGSKRRPAVVQRWYATLSFGGEEKKLAISASAARWLMGAGA